MKSERKPTVRRVRSVRGTGAADAIAPTDSPGGPCGSTGEGLSLAPSSRLRIKAFSATKAKDREVLGEKVTEWIRSLPPRTEILNKEIRQSSDNEFHCLSITLFVLLPTD